MYHWLADIIVLFHASLVLTVVVGTVLVVARKAGRVPRFWSWAYAAAMLGMVISQLLIGDCILTVWEKGLRNLARPGSAYRESFVGHYLPFLPPFIIRDVGPALVLAACVMLGWEWAKRRNRV